MTLRNRLAALTMGVMFVVAGQCNAQASGSAKSVAEDASNAASPGSMCDPADEVVLSCPITKAGKQLSMCAAKPAGEGARRFYYAYGRPGAPELTYPPKNVAANDAFTRTHLGFAGNTGGYAYGFVTHGYKYMVFSVAGERGSQHMGVIVQHQGDGKIVAEMRCQGGKIVETESDRTIDETLKWKSDPAIEANGLPAHP